MPLKTMDVLKNKWPMAKVTAAKSHQNGLVRSVYLKSSDRPERQKQKLLWNNLLIKLYCCWK